MDFRNEALNMVAMKSKLVEFRHSNMLGSLALSLIHI